jgi:hypothetical protein
LPKPAVDVVLMGSPGIVEFTKEPVTVTRDDKAVWSVTIGALQGGFHI